MCSLDLALMGRTIYGPAAAILLLCLSFAQAQTCYFPDGQTESPQDVPCNSSAPASACCNKANLCMENGLCLLDGVMSRGSCTDKNWGSDCPNFCTEEGNSGGITLYPCSQYGGIFSCSWENCSSVFPINGGNGVLLRPSQVSALGLPGALVSATDVLQVSTATSSSNTTAYYSSAPSNESAKYTAGDMAGVGAGVGIPLLLALLGALFLLWRERKAGRNKQQTAQTYEPIQQQQAMYNNYPLQTPKQPGQQVHEELASTHYGEMEGSRERQELPGHMSK